MAALSDKFGRPITDLRIAITDQLQLQVRLLPHRQRGRALRRPAVRRLPAHGARFRRTRHQEGPADGRRTAAAPRHRRLRPRPCPAAHSRWQPLDIALTTNGHLLADLAQPLKDAGLNRVTVSAWTPSILTASPASRACPEATTTCSPESAPPSAPASSP